MSVDAVLADVLPLLRFARDEGDGHYRATCPWCNTPDALLLNDRDFKCAAPECGTVGRLDALASKLGEPRAIVTLAELLDNPDLLKPPECVVPYLAYRGRLVVLAGPDKSGKSTLLAHAAAALSRRAEFLGEPTGGRTGRTLWAGLEEAPGDAVRRFSELHADPGLLQLVVLQPTDLLAKMDALLDVWPADLVVVDCLAEYSRIVRTEAPEDGDSGAWGSVVRPLVALARKRDVAVVLLHHVRRSDGQYRGSSEIPAAADALLELAVAKSGEDPTTRHVTGRGRWSVEPFDLTFHEGRYELAGAAPISLDALILLHLESTPGQSGSALAKALGKNKTAVLAGVRKLLDRGAIEERTGRYGPEYSLPSGQTRLEVVP